MTDNQNQPAIQPPPQPPVPAPAMAAPKNVPTTKNGAGFWVTLMAMLGFILGEHALYQDMFATASAKGIYVVDGERLAYSYIAQAESKRNALLHSGDFVDGANYQLRLQEIEMELAGNLQKIQDRIRQMSDSGMVVLQRSSVLAYPPQADMTAKIANELGIALIPAQTAAGPLPQAAVPNALPPASNSTDTPLPGEGKELD